jgi:hypothetical protein
VSDVVDGTAVEESTALVERPHEAPALFRTDDPVEVLSKAAEVANALKGVVKQQGLIQNISGKEHPKVEAWQTLGSMLGVTAVCTHTEKTQDRHGKFAYLAHVEARLNGQVVGRGEAMCSTSENRWAKADDYAILSMAQTRATSKALKGPLGWVMKLAGYEATPAEEMPGERQEPEQPKLIGRERVQALAAKFGQHDNPYKEAAAWLGLDLTDDPSQHHQQVAAAVVRMTPKQADEFEAWLGSLA